eukprot:96512-Prymnesium_polylepis.2
MGESAARESTTGSTAPSWRCRSNECSHEGYVTACHAESDVLPSTSSMSFTPLSHVRTARDVARRPIQGTGLRTCVTA